MIIQNKILKRYYKKSFCNIQQDFSNCQVIILNHPQTKPPFASAKRGLK